MRWTVTVLEHLATQTGMLGEVFKRARPEVQNTVTPGRLNTGRTATHFGREFSEVRAL